MRSFFALRCACFSTCLALALLSSVWADIAPDSDAQQSAYRSSIAQESVRKQTDKIQAEITELITELKLNGIESADLTLLSNASGHLRTLSQEDMQKVIGALQSASMATQTQDRQQSLVNALHGQQAIALNLKSLAADLAAQESQKELPSRLESLIARQSANLRQTKTLGDAPTPEQLNTQLKTTHQVVSSEQDAIGGEIDLLLKVLAAKQDVPPAPGATDVVKAVLEAMNGVALPGTAQQATQLTSAGPFPDAVTKQAAVRDGLTAALRVALSNVDRDAQLQQARTELRQILNDQKDLANAAQQAKLDGSTLADRQARMEDRAAATQALMKAASPEAAKQLDQAQQAMDKSATALAQAKNPADTAAQQQAATDALQKTEALLDQQIAAAQKADAMTPTDKLAQLQQLQNEIKQAQQNPQATAGDVQKMQQDAAPISPQAANDLANATDQLQKPQPDAAAAQQALTQANTDVQKQEDALKQDAQAYQALNQASQQLAQAQQQATAANQAMQNTPNNLTQAARDLTQAQATVDQAQKNAGQAGVPQAAQQAMQQASDALKAATMQAVQAQGAGAQAQAQQAMAAMQKAQAGMGQAMAQIQQRGQGQKGQQQQGPSNQALATAAPNQESQVLGGYGAGGTAQVMGGLKAKDRDAISQYQAEKSPPEYAPLVQQYLKNLADSSETH